MTSPFDPGIIVVDAASTAGTPDGRSWPCAFQNLQGALNHASNPLNGVTEIWVAASATPYTPSVGIDPNFQQAYFASPYTPDDEDRMLTFQLVKNVGIYGGFLGNATGGGETSRSQADPINNVTILSGDLGEDGSAYHVLYYFQPGADNTPPDPDLFIIDGFTITGGNANGGDDESSQGGLNAMGGGALIVYGKHSVISPLGPVFSRCKFIDNSAELGGGAIGGIYGGCRVVECTFENNQQTATSGTEFFEISRGGGAINVMGPVAILKSTFKDNDSVEQGGAIRHSGFITSTSTVVVSNCKFYENTAPTGGAIGALDGQVVNSLFAGNAATTGDGDGGAIFCGSRDGLTLLDCTFVTASDDVASALRDATTSHDRRGVDTSKLGVEVFVRSLTVTARCGR